MNAVAKQDKTPSKESAEGDLIAQIGKLLAKEYIALMRQQKEEDDESRDLCPVLERESKTAEH